MFPFFYTREDARSTKALSIQEVSEFCAEADVADDKAHLSAICPASKERTDDYKTRTGYQCPEIDDLKTSGRPLAPLYDAFSMSPYTSLLKTSHSGLGIHPLVSVPELGSFLHEWELAEAWAFVVSGGLRPDTSMRSPRQLLYLAHSECYVNEEPVTLGNVKQWKALRERLQNLDPDSDTDIFKAASYYKRYETMLGGHDAAISSLVAFASRSAKFDTVDDSYIEDKFERATVAVEEGPANTGILQEHTAAKLIASEVRYNVEQQRPEIFNGADWRTPTDTDTERLLSRVFTESGIHLNRQLVLPMYNAVSIFNAISPFEDYVKECNDRQKFTAQDARAWLHSEFFLPIWGYDLDDRYYEWLATHWPGHLFGNFLDRDGGRPTYSPMLYGDQRIGKDQSILKLFPSALSEYVLEYQFTAAKELAMAGAGRAILLMPELGMADQRTISMAKFKMMITNMPGFRRLYSPIVQQASTSFFFVFTVNLTETYLLEPAQMSSRLPSIDFRPTDELRGPGVGQFVEANRDKFWAAAYATMESPAILPQWMADESHRRFPVSPDTPCAVVLASMDVQEGRTYAVRELIMESPLGDGHIRNEITRAVRSELVKLGWKAVGSRLKCPENWCNPYLTAEN